MPRQRLSLPRTVLAAALGFSRSATYDLAAAGMPTDDIEAAHAWLAQRRAAGRGRGVPRPHRTRAPMSAVLGEDGDDVQAAREEAEVYAELDAREQRVDAQLGEGVADALTTLHIALTAAAIERRENPADVLANKIRRYVEEAVGLGPPSFDDLPDCRSNIEHRAR